MFELDTVRQIGKIHVRVRGTPGLPTFFNDVTVEVGATTGSLVFFDSYFQPGEANATSIVVFENPAGLINGKFIRFTKGPGDFIIGEVIAIIGL